MTFKKLIAKLKGKNNISVDLIDFDGQNVSTGDVGGYILYLYTKYKFNHIGYRYENIDGFRFVLYTTPDNNKVIRYFKDRCPAIVEYECRRFGHVCKDHEFKKWSNGFEEVVKKHNKTISGGIVK